MIDKTTLVIPTKNAAKYLNSCLNSISNELSKKHYAIFVDASSQDETKKIFYKYKKKFQTIKFIKNRNLNIALSLNKGIKNSKSEYISRLDSDDEISNSRIDKQIKYLIKNEDIALVGSNFEIINQNSKTIGNSNLLLNFSDILLDFIITGNIQVAHPTITFKKSEIKKVNYYTNLNYSEDYDLFLKLIMKRFKIENLPGSLTKIRIHDTQKSKAFNNSSLQSMKESYKRILNQHLRIKLSKNFIDTLFIKFNHKKKYSNNHFKKFYIKKIFLIKKLLKFFMIKKDIHIKRLIINEINYNYFYNYKIFYFNFINKKKILFHFYDLKKINFLTFFYLLLYFHIFLIYFHIKFIYKKF
jgi:glycosyltransferase involved in cell wall biosynthesis